jgi:DcmR-like sensory protein
MSSWSNLLESADPDNHVVQLYGEDEQLLVRNVSGFVREGLRRGEGVLLVATRQHTEAFIRRLSDDGADPTAAIEEGRLRLLDAQGTLARFMVDGEPSWDLFQSVIGAAAREVRARVKGGRLRAFGEMVGLLWNEGKHSAAIRLEEHWNRLLRSESLSLYCAYPIDVFGGELPSPALDDLFAVHTHICAGPRTLYSSPVAARSEAQSSIEN